MQLHFTRQGVGLSNQGGSVAPWRSSIWSSAMSRETPRASSHAANQARDEFGADVVMVPELAVSGYPPEDLLFHSGMRAAGDPRRSTSSRPTCAASP